MVISQIGTFVSAWKRLGLQDTDLQALEILLMSNPTAGAVMSGTNGLRKVRFSPPSRAVGKSGATRVCYVWFPSYARLYLVTIFEKTAKANLTKAERNAVATVVKRIKDALDRGVPYA